MAKLIKIVGRSYRLSLIATWITSASLFAVAIFVSAPRDQVVPQLIGFGIGLAFWAGWRLGDVTSRRASHQERAEQ